MRYSRGILRWSGTAALVLAGTAMIGGCLRTPSAEPRAIEQGRDAAAEIDAQIPRLPDGALVRHVAKIGQKLAARTQRSELTYRFAVVDLPTPNAFALPDGSVYVTRGLIALLVSDDELAGVLGHEIAHVAARHSAKEQTRRVPFLPLDIATAIGGAAVGVVSPGLGRLVTGLAKLPEGLVLAGFSRGQEREADELAVALTAQAGFDPRGLAGALDGLTRYERFVGENPELTSFLATHPSSPSRREEVLAYASARGALPPVSAAGGDAFDELLDDLLVGTSAREGSFEKQRFAHPVLGFALTFPDKWETQNASEGVFARAQDKSAFAALTLTEKGTKLAEAASAFAREQGLDGEPVATRINGLAARQQVGDLGTRFNRVRGVFTFIGHDDNVYRIACIGDSAQSASLERTCRSLASSFRALNAAERAAVTETRLRIVRAGANETPDALAKRVGSPWSGEELALHNRVPADQALPDGMTARVAQTVRWKP